MTSQHKFTTAKSASQYIFAGNATVTLKSVETGKHFTFKIMKAKPTPGWNTSDCYFVRLLTGPDNGNDYQYLGMIDGSVLKTTKKSKLGPDAPSFKALAWTLKNLALDHLSPKLSLYHHGKCGRCNRELTVPESVETGLGPDCAAMMGVKWACTSDKTAKPALKEPQKNPFFVTPSLSGGFKIMRYDGSGSAFVTEGTRASGGSWPAAFEAQAACDSANRGNCEGISFGSYADD